MERGFDDVWFDCDSTLSTIEGIDELAALRPGLGPKVVELTRQAMAGEIPIAEVYGRRLELIRPTREELELVARRYAATLTPDSPAVIALLRAAGRRVRILSGGLLPAVLGAARALGLPSADVHAVDITCDAAGRYVDFDRRSPLARNGGKAEVLARERTPGGRAVLVGDGMTDAEAAPAVDLFVGYGGVVLRDAVRRVSPYYLSAPSLAPLLLLVLTDAELACIAADPKHRPLVAAAEALRPTIERNLR